MCGGHIPENKWLIRSVKDLEMIMGQQRSHDNLESVMCTERIFTSNFFQEDHQADHAEDSEELCLTLDEDGVRTFGLSALYLRPSASHAQSM